jgi:hypothetical protein
VVAEVRRADPDPMQEDADRLLVAERAEEREALLVRAVRPVVVAGEPQRAGEAPQRAGPQPVRQLVREELLEATGPLERIRRHPEVLEHDHQLGGVPDATICHRPVDRRANVFLLAKQ